MKDRVKYSLPPPLHESCHWLMISHGKDRQRQTFFDASKHYYYTRIIPELHNKIVLSSSYGWLVLKDSNSQTCSLLNLVSMEMIWAPPINLNNYKFCILWLPPSNPNCHIFFIFKDFLMSWKPGDMKFIKKEFRVEVEEYMSFFTVTVHKGIIYALAEPNSDYVFANFEDEIISFKKLIKRNYFSIGVQEGNPNFDMYLIESCGEILLVNKIYSECFGNQQVVYNFKIYRIDYSQDGWVAVENIGKQAIFLSNSQGKFCNVSCSGLQTNSVYFTQGRNLYIFSLDDQSIKICLPCPIVNKHNSTLSWIL